MLEVGSLVVSRNGEFGWIERFGGPTMSPWAMVRNIEGYRQSFGIHGLRRPDPEVDFEIFIHIEDAQEIR